MIDTIFWEKRCVIHAFETHFIGRLLPSFVCRYFRASAHLLGVRRRIKIMISEAPPAPAARARLSLFASSSGILARSECPALWRFCDLAIQLRGVGDIRMRKFTAGLERRHIGISIILQL